MCRAGQTKLNIVVIGAGFSGLGAAKYAIQSGHSVTVYEQTTSLGGTWIYTDATGTDEYGIDIHTSMYSGLYTNIPKEVMSFCDNPIQTEKSYCRSEDVLNYLESYAKHFNVTEKIKFCHQVIRVRPVQVTKWEVIVKDLRQNSVETHIYDAIFVCVGHFSVPYYPSPPYPGTDLFIGRQSHSHDYRQPNQFEGKTVLVIGTGPSGIDIAYDISKAAKYVYISGQKHNPNEVYPLNVSAIGPLEEFTTNGAIFVDGTQHELDEILFCTGYKTEFPFLSTSCGLSITNSYVQPLYKTIININYPTMAIIGLPFIALQLVDIQMRFTMKFLNGEKRLPSKADMQADIDLNTSLIRAAPRFNIRKPHEIPTLALVRDYYNQLASEADVENVRDVIIRIYEDCWARKMEMPNTYRNDVYHIIDEYHFTKNSTELD